MPMRLLLLFFLNAKQGKPWKYAVILPSNANNPYYAPL